MPDYDFRCLHCERKFTRYISYADYGRKKVACPHCGSQNVRRRISRVRIARSESSRMAEFDDFSDVDDLSALEDNPRALGKMMRKMSKELGEEMGPDFNEVVDRLESGQSTEEIEKDLPDLGNDL